MCCCFSVCGVVLCFFFFFFFKQKTAYGMRISDWSSDVCSSDLCDLGRLVILDSQGANSESFLVARAFRLLRREKPEILSVISYADPVRRVDADGHVFLPGHVGGLYSVKIGRASCRKEFVSTCRSRWSPYH